MTKYTFVPTANDLQNTHLARKNYTETKISKYPIQWDIYQHIIYVYIYVCTPQTQVLQSCIQKETSNDIYIWDST